MKQFGCQFLHYGTPFFSNAAGALAWRMRGAHPAAGVAAAGGISSATEWLTGKSGFQLAVSAENEQYTA
ncbi:hypothetical protein Hsw_1598 [Hymenobacter swuensis DY53]|uniref:Uncharacterized protein n=1 Tax=Hymenobacter swuensis DY53 TaxID=1227739 RepID=W8EX87_9BACT|nr:hypothetical protein Hsw_1598 [Hymenobacter swuensis DY53]